MVFHRTCYLKYIYNLRKPSTFVNFTIVINWDEICHEARIPPTILFSTRNADLLLEIEDARYNPIIRGFVNIIFMHRVDLRKVHTDRLHKGFHIRSEILASYIAALLSCFSRLNLPKIDRNCLVLTCGYRMSITTSLMISNPSDGEISRGNSAQGLESS